MKQPKKLTLANKKLLGEFGLNPNEWMNLFEDDLYLHIVKKDSFLLVQLRRCRKGQQDIYPIL